LYTRVRSHLALLWLRYELLRSTNSDIVPKHRIWPKKFYNISPNWTRSIESEIVQLVQSDVLLVDRLSQYLRAVTYNFYTCKLAYSCKIDNVTR